MAAAAWITAAMVTAAETQISIPNASFETPVTTFVNTNVDSWQKVEQPTWYDDAEFLWSQLIGTFLNPAPGAGNRIDNCHGLQAVWLFAVPEVEMFQDYETMDWNDTVPSHAFNATFEVGKSYTLTVGVIGGGGGMQDGVSLRLSLYYRDAGGNLVDVSNTEVVRSLEAFPSTNHLEDCTVHVPVVQPGDAWAGKKIGVRCVSTVSFELQGGYWDLDNFRLKSEIPLPRVEQTLAGTNVQVSWISATGASYLLQTSGDLRTWTPFGTAAAGTGAVMGRLVPRGSANEKFFRVKVTQ